MSYYTLSSDSITTRFYTFANQFPRVAVYDKGHIKLTC